MAQARTLLSLRDCGPQRITDLAQLERVRQPTMSALIARMEEFGWVARVAGEADRRAVFVRLTDEGKSIIDEAEAARNAALNSYLGALSGDDLAALSARSPATPSSPMPVSTTPSAPSPNASATVRNRWVAEGRWLPMGGLALRATVPSVVTPRWESGGAISTSPPRRG